MQALSKTLCALESKVGIRPFPGPLAEPIFVDLSLQMRLDVVAGAHRRPKQTSAIPSSGRIRSTPGYCGPLKHKIES